MVTKVKLFSVYGITKKVVLNDIFMVNITSHQISDSENFKGHKR